MLKCWAPDSSKEKERRAHAKKKIPGKFGNEVYLRGVRPPSPILLTTAPCSFVPTLGSQQRYVHPRALSRAPLEAWPNVFIVMRGFMGVFLAAQRKCGRRSYDFSLHREIRPVILTASTVSHNETTRTPTRRNVSAHFSVGTLLSWRSPLMLVNVVFLAFSA